MKNTIRPGGVSQDLPLGLCRDINSFTYVIQHPHLETMLSGIGIIATHQAKDWGFSGVMLRGSGVCWNSRRKTPYDVHDQPYLDTPTFSIVQCPNQMPSGMIKADDCKLCTASRNRMKLSMESLTHHFEPYTHGRNCPYRCKIRVPGSYHAQGLDYMSKHHLPADVVNIVGTQDIVSREVDRYEKVD
ncbi:hypothetical protein MKX03_034660 [Papaver bracteatum]|nr:hypothetical protein MKX03_034660 [Papaver bracteatum]